MSINLPGAAGSYGEVSSGIACRFGGVSEVWSVGIQWRASSLSSSHTTVSKWQGGTADRNFLIRVTSTGIQVYQHALIRIQPPASSAPSLDVWYTSFVTHNGAGTMTLHTYRHSDGTWLDQAVTGSISTDPLNNALFRYGAYNSGGTSSPWDGDLAHGICFEGGVATADEVVRYAHDPWGTAAYFIPNYNVDIYHPLGIASPDPDWAGDTNTVTLNGTWSRSSWPIAQKIGPFAGNVGFGAAVAAPEPPTRVAGHLINHQPLTGLVDGGLAA